MKNKTNSLTFRNIVLIALFSALAVVIQIITGVPFVASPILVMFVSCGLSMLVTGPIYILMSAKTARTGTVFLFALIQALYMSIIGQILIGVMFAVGALVSEIVLIKGGYHKPLRVGVAYGIYGVFYSIGTYLPYILMKDSYTAQLLAQGYSQKMIDTMLVIFSNPVLVLLAALNSVAFAALGAYVGYRMMKKHFRPAGVA